MLDIDKLVTTILKTISEPMKRLADRVKTIEDRKLPDEKQIVEAVMSGMEPALAALGKQLETIKERLAERLKKLEDRGEREKSRIDDLMAKADLAYVELAEEFDAMRASFASLTESVNTTIKSLPDIPKTISEAIESLPKPKDGVDGKSITIEDCSDTIKSAVDQAVSPLPTLVGQLVESAVAKIPSAKDGVGVTGGVIDRAGDLVLTLADGKVLNVGRVVGQSVDMAELETRVKSMFDAIPKPRDGFGFEDMSVEHDGERTFTLKFARGDKSEAFSFKTPIMIYRNVYRAGERYEQGDVVTWGGGMWHCNKETDTKPGDDNDNWTLAVKRGRNGKEVVSSGPKKPPIVKV